MQYKERYTEQVRALQRTAGIKINEEVTVSSSGVEMEASLEEKQIHGYNELLDAANSARTAEEIINKLIADPKFNDKFKVKFQSHLNDLKRISKDLTNISQWKY
jgi:ubiquinone biosynthesis protein Coq4